MSSRTPRTRLSGRALRTRARSTVSLGMVGALAIPLIGWSNSVAVNIDGQTVTARTYAGTVSEVLDQLDVEVGPADEVTPAPSTPLANGINIEVARAITVDVFVDGGRARRVTAPVSSVAGVLEEAGLEDVRERGATLRPGWTAPVQDGDEIHVALPKPVQLTVDGETHEFETLVSSVDRLLLEQDVELGKHDRIWPAVDEPIDGPVNVVIQRVAFDEEVEEITLERDEVRRETDDLRKGTTRVADEGRDGLRVETYRLEKVDGEVVEREKVSSEVVREPQPRVILVGTYVPPPPPPPKPKPVASSTGGSTSTSNVWDRLARCESGGNWSLNTGNGYYGGLQFSLSTWRNVGGSGYPHENSRAEQIRRAEILLQRTGGKYSRSWPHCSKQLGLP